MVIEENIEFVAYPKFEDVFVSHIDPLAKYVFLPIVEIRFKNHPIIGNKKLYIVTLWDTGDYKKHYFGEYREDVNEISFDIIEDKLDYGDKIAFPKQEFLEKAYNIILKDFEKQKDSYLNDLEYDNTRGKITRGKNLILSAIPEFGDFEAGYYFERITSYLLSKTRYEMYGAVNPLFNENSYFVSVITEGKNSEQDFNKIGKLNLVDKFMTKPEWEQNDETPEGLIFIGQVNEWHYLSSSSTNTYLFYDIKKNRIKQIFQWD